MKQRIIQTFLTACFTFFATANLFAQGTVVQGQKAYVGNNSGANALEDSIKRDFKNKNLSWPPQAVYIRSFKYDRKLELWVIAKPGDSIFSLFKTYNICMQSGSIGPKREEGDNQVPEGFYYINEFNAKSNYHMSLGLNYPNASDKYLCNAKKPGGNIFIHGNCVSVGCIAIQDAPVEEVFFIASQAKASGQEFVPVHVFPVKYDVPGSLEYLTNSAKGPQADHTYILNIKTVFDYFQKNKKLPVIMINKKGDYVIN